MGVATPVAWFIHFMIGAIWGALFAALYTVIPGKSSIAKGMVFGSAAWLLMVLMIMPMVGVGLFGVKLGIMAPVMTWMLHLVFGIVLGLVYARRTSAH